jgi:FkbM family methyltransferase
MIRFGRDPAFFDIGRMHRNAFLKSLPIVVVDVGARDGINELWDNLSPDSVIIAFEPDTEEYNKLQKRYLKRSAALPAVRMQPEALWHEIGQATLYQTRKADCSSLFRPNRGLLDRFANDKRFDVVKEHGISLARLDQVLERNGLEAIQFLKIDTQGTELNILKGAGAYLQQCLGVQCEVEFQPLYDTQPLFGDVDAFLRYAGFTLFDLQLQRWTRKNFSRTDPYAGGKQVIWADVLYLRDFVDSPDQISFFPEAEHHLVLAKTCVLAELLGFSDYAFELASYARKRKLWPESIRWPGQAEVEGRFLSDYIGIARSRAKLWRPLHRLLSRI